MMNEGNDMWRRIALGALYGGLALLLLLIIPGVLDTLISPRLAGRIAYNSEGYLFALVLAAWIQFVLPRLRGGARVPWGLMHGAVWALIGVGLLASDLPSRVVTLNEPAFALALLIPYVSIPRPLPRWVRGAVPVLVGVTVWAVGWAPQSWVIDQAETFGFVVLAMLTLDFFDRELLDAEAQVNRALRWGWYGFMILEPVVVSLIGTQARSGGTASALALEYLGRIHESFIGVLLVALMLHVAPAYRGALSASAALGTRRRT